MDHWVVYYGYYSDHPEQMRVCTSEEEAQVWVEAQGWTRPFWIVQTEPN